MKKRIMAAILSVLVVVGMIGIPKVAADGIQPRWDNAQRIALDMTYSNGKVNWSGSVQGKSGTTSISATFTLSKMNSNGTYTQVDSWSKTSSSLILTNSGSYTGTKGTYKLEVSGTVVKGGVSESITDSLVKTF